MPGTEVKLTRQQFNEKFRFREARREGLVNCASCVYRSGGVKRDEVALCQHPERLRGIKIAMYYGRSFGKLKSENISYQRVCDAHTPKPLPVGIVVPIIPNKHAALLSTQWRDPYHADPNCPYVLEELRMIETGERTKEGRTGEIFIADLSDMVPGGTIRDICEMPCCERKLPFQISRQNDYRIRAGIKPDGKEPIKWVRNGIVKHESKAAMTPKEAESFFDLTAVISGHKGIHDKIVAVSSHLCESCNWLGSRPLAEAANPVVFSNNHHFRNEPMSNQYSEQFWAYDERLFDRNKELKVPLHGLEKIPEGFILCLDTKGVLRRGMADCSESSPMRFLARGIVKPMEDQTLLSKGLSHFIDIREVNYTGSQHMWGEFGIGFSGLASFDAE